jgi:trimeric autotransporter adhesin
MKAFGEMAKCGRLTSAGPRNKSHDLFLIRLKNSSTSCRRAGKSLLDYVIRRFNLSSARLNKPRGWIFAETPRSAIPQIQLEPRVSRSEVASSKRLVRMVPGFSLNWIAINAVQQSSLKQKLRTKNMTTLHLRKSIGRSPLRFRFLLIPLVLVCFAFSPTARAVLPAPDGGYPNGNTAEGQNALFSLTTGFNNTAVGFEALQGVQNASDNTATGFKALWINQGSQNTATGAGALLGNNLGAFNTATGYIALTSNYRGNNNTATGATALQLNQSGSQNTATGAFALSSNTSGGYNTATGYHALYHNTFGNANTATGQSALFSNTTGTNNTATGDTALALNTSGHENAATGVNALYNNTTGHSNTANGIQVLFGNTTGFENTATGAYALLANTTGSKNTANGGHALDANLTGNYNTATGFNALTNNRTGVQNTATGSSALQDNTGGNFNTAIGENALLSNLNGSNNVGVGYNAGSSLTTGLGNVCIGQGVLGVAGESNTTRIRNIYSSVASGRAVYVNSDNKIGTLVSSRRFKEEIKPMDKASEAILALKPVTFHYKKEIEPNGALMFGLIAEEVEKVDPELVTRDSKGEVETVRYEAVNAMLLNEFLRVHRTVQEQQREIDALKGELKEQRALIQKVSDKVELDKPAPQTVLNSQ